MGPRKQVPDWLKTGHGPQDDLCPLPLCAKVPQSFDHSHRRVQRYKSDELFVRQLRVSTLNRDLRPLPSEAFMPLALADVPRS